MNDWAWPYRLMRVMDSIGAAWLLRKVGLGFYRGIEKLDLDTRVITLTGLRFGRIRRNIHRFELGLRQLAAPREVTK